MESPNCQGFPRQTRLHSPVLSTGPSPLQPSDPSPETTARTRGLGQSPGPSTGSHTGGFRKNITNGCVSGAWRSHPCPVTLQVWPGRERGGPGGLAVPRQPCGPGCSWALQVAPRLTAIRHLSLPSGSQVSCACQLCSLPPAFLINSRQIRFLIKKQGPWKMESLQEAAGRLRLTGKGVQRWGSPLREGDSPSGPGALRRPQGVTGLGLAPVAMRTVPHNVLSI